MKFGRTLLVLGGFILLLSSCDNLLSIDSGGQGNFPSVPQYRTFRAQNLVTSSFYSVQSQLLYEGVKCNVWAELSSGVTPDTAKNVAYNYDNIVYPRMMSAFNSGEPFYEGGKIVATNPVEYASALAGGDGKLTLLLLDIIDDCESTGVLVGGYFLASDLFPRRVFQNSNEEAMIYLDANPVQPGSAQSNGFLAHEMQHIMNFAISVARRSNRNDAGLILLSSIRQMDLWIDEGLSLASEWIWSEQQDLDRIKWYVYDPAGTIARGNNFFVWGNHKYDDRSILDEYSTVYIFFQWLRLQAGGAGIYKGIINSPYSDYRAVTTAANNAMGGEGYDDWDTLLKTWLAANYINAPSGKYGYKNDDLLKNIRARTMPSGVRSINLYPGEGVYSITNAAFFWPGRGTNIRYAGLTGNAPWLSDESTYPGGALLTYNISKDTGGSSESGITTGIAASVNTFAGLSRSAAFTGPYAIGAGDVLRRNGHEGVSFSDLVKFASGNKDLE